MLHILNALTLLICVNLITASGPTDVRLDEKAKEIHRIDTINILIYVFLLILTVVTIWVFKHHRVRYLHETGLAIIYGLVVGAIIRYAGMASEITHLPVEVPANNSQTFLMPPDTLWIQLEVNAAQTNRDPAQGVRTNKTYAYTFRGEVVDEKNNEIDQKDLAQQATFDPEIFFNILLPPIIFSAGYGLKRKYFFRNLGAIMTLALLGTTISCFVTASLMFGFLQFLDYVSFTFNDCLLFGALISATDPVTILAIFNDLHVDVNLYALVFGESVLNDAVAIALASAVQSYEEAQSRAVPGFETSAFIASISNFVAILCGSFSIGCGIGCLTAFVTKFTRLRDSPLLETALFFIMSYSSFLMAEAADLTGIVAVLFCGISQAHYTYNNLSSDSKARTKEIFELLNFLAENFIFSYIGVSMFTFQKHNWDASFILLSFFAIAVGRAVNIYPLCILLNIGRTHKIKAHFQHMLFFAGLRGAMAFALAIRNTLSVARQTMLTATSVIVIFSVIVCGGMTSQVLTWLGIPKGVEDDREQEMTQFSQIQGDGVMQAEGTVQRFYEKAWLARKWYNFDAKFMKPLLTHSKPTLMETMPECCMPLAKIFTSTEQMSRDSALSKAHGNLSSNHATDQSTSVDGQTFI